MRMLRLRIFVFTITVSIVLTFINPVVAKSSAEYADIGQSFWSAFECAILAEIIGKKKEQTRLFSSGYENGLIFIDALKSEKIKQDDVSARVPLVVLMLLGGPSPDFMLGRIYENAAESIYGGLKPKTADTILDITTHDKLHKMKAESEYQKRNCQIIGK